MTKDNLREDIRVRILAEASEDDGTNWFKLNQGEWVSAENTRHIFNVAPPLDSPYQITIDTEVKDQQ